MLEKSNNWSEDRMQTSPTAPKHGEKFHNDHQKL